MNTRVVVTNLHFARSLGSRLIGLLGTKSIAPGYGLLISPCNQVHTFFMNFVIDVIFLDHSNHIVKICPKLKPWRLSPLVWKAKTVLEMNEGGSEGLRVGDLLQIGANTIHVNSQ